MRLFLDTSATNGTTYTYKACVLNASGGETAFSPEVVLTPTAQNPTCSATLTSETGTSQASGAVWANLSAFSQGVEGLALCLDGEYVDFSGKAQPSLSYDSECGRNGLRAAVVVVWDEQKRYGFSDITPMTFDNEFSVATLSVPEINPDMLETVLFACKLKAPQRFRVDVVEHATLNVVKTWTSLSPDAAVTYQWDGTHMYGAGVEDDTYRFVVTLIDKPGQPKTKPKRLEVSRVGLGQARAILVNAMHHDVGPMMSGYARIAHIRAACKRVGLSVKVFQPGNAYWRDYGPDGMTPGVASWIKSSGTRMVYIFTHGNHNVRYPDPGTTSFVMRSEPGPLALDPKAAKGVISVRNSDIQALGLPWDPPRLRLVWVDACGSGRRYASINEGNLKDPESWTKVSMSNANDMAYWFWGGSDPDYYVGDPACYYMGYFGMMYMDAGPYIDMVRLFFQRFSEGSGVPYQTTYTIGQVMQWLSGRSEVTSDFQGPPAHDWYQGQLWLMNSPPFYNIRVFTDSLWGGTSLYYGGLKMSDMR
ncbi:MAG: hypothetical protein AMXMBFR61_21450 [Fimbriimonadales bacterium]